MTHYASTYYDIVKYKYEPPNINVYRNLNSSTFHYVSRFNIFHVEKILLPFPPFCDTNHRNRVSRISVK